MNLDDFFEIVDTSLKRMAAPIAVIGAGFLLAMEAMEGDAFLGISAKQFIYSSIALSSLYVGAIIFAGCKKMNGKSDNKKLLFFLKLVYSSIFIFATLGAASLAIDKAI
ncbi:hypothetical protein [Alteromonas flava]|uniref:hypothetical protein n=1 Tax=Alteromonas flava TaxID=2048003 RepID=UPI000C2889FD|nr:hypothetical protein [Alteromonas flava]